MFGKVLEIRHRQKKTPFYPRSPYGVSKVFSHWITINYRESYGIFAFVMEFYLITKVQEEARHLLQEKLQLDCQK